MKIWTIQKEEVVDIIMREGYYQPDVNKSDFVKENPDLKSLYQLILDGFNYNNHANSPGVIFGFMESNGNTIQEIDDFEQFLNRHMHQMGVLWNRMLKQEKLVLLELEYNVEFNPIFIDLNDFQFLMPPIVEVYPYEESDIDRLCSNILSGEVYYSKFPSGIIQAHVPNIFREDIVRIYHVDSASGKIVEKDTLQQKVINEGIGHPTMSDKEIRRKLQLFIHSVKNYARDTLKKWLSKEEVHLDYTNIMNFETMLPCLTYYGDIDGVRLDAVDISNIYMACEFCILHGLNSWEEALIRATAIMLVNEFQEQYRNFSGKTSQENEMKLQEFADIVQEYAEKNLKEYLKIDNLHVAFQDFQDGETGKTRLLYDASIDDRKIEKVEMTDLYRSYEFCDRIENESLKQDIVRTAVVTLLAVFQGEYLYPLV